MTTAHEFARRLKEAVGVLRGDGSQPRRRSATDAAARPATDPGEAFAARLRSALPRS